MEQLKASKDATRAVRETAETAKSVAKIIMTMGFGKAVLYFLLS